MKSSNALTHIHPSCSAMFKDLRYCRDEVIDLDRLALIRVEPCAHNPLPVFTHHGRGHGYDGDLPSGRLRAERLSTSIPSMPGSRMSVRTRLGGRSWARQTPASPVSASMVV